MRTVGVIAEYNPFHPGHAHQLKEARRLSQADCVAVVMSSCFTQRGDAAILSPAVRTRMALEQGADIVFALPVCWSVRDAEQFALGGVHLLQLAGVDAISFGAESSDLSQLLRAASLLENAQTLTDHLRQQLDQGLPYPAALASAVSLTDPDLSQLLKTPNNTLAVCYLRAIQRLQCSIEPFPVHRTSDYHATSVEATPSASALRHALLQGNWPALQHSLSPDTYSHIVHEARSGRIHRSNALDQALLYRLRTMSDAEWLQLPDLSEGINDRLRKASVYAASREELIQSAKTRRYPYARLSRLCTHALLNMTQSQLDTEPLPEALWLLGFRDSALPLLRTLKSRNISVISKVSAPSVSSAWFRTEVMAYDLWALGAGLPAGLAKQQGVIRV